MPIAAEPGLAYLGPEPAAPGEQSGHLTIVWVDPATPTAVPKEQQVSPPGKSSTRIVTDLSTFYGAPRVAPELRNDSDAPVTFLEWTITPVGEAASDEHQATPTT